MLEVIKALAKGSKRYTPLMSELTSTISIGKARRALEMCQKEGYVIRPEKGVYEITERGESIVTLIEKEVDGRSSTSVKVRRRKIE